MSAMSTEQKWAQLTTVSTQLNHSGSKHAFGDSFNTPRVLVKLKSDSNHSLEMHHRDKSPTKLKPALYKPIVAYEGQLIMHATASIHNALADDLMLSHVFSFMATGPSQELIGLQLLQNVLHSSRRALKLFVARNGFETLTVMLQ